jgi:hypothetical protein
MGFVTVQEYLQVPCCCCFSVFWVFVEGGHCKYKLFTFHCLTLGAVWAAYRLDVVIWHACNLCLIFFLWMDAVLHQRCHSSV